MRRLIKSRDYLKRCLGFLLIFGFMSLGAIVGCNGDSSVGGSLVVVDAILDAVVRVDPTTGDRTIISRGIDPNDVYDMVGSGPAFAAPSGIAVEADGSLVVVDSNLRAVVRVDLTTDNMGNRTIISGIDPNGVYDMVGSGPAFVAPFGIAVEADGSLVVVDFGLDAVVRVDLTTDNMGNRTIISGIDPNGVYDMVGSGTAFGLPSGIAVEADGSLVVVDGILDAVVRVDLTTDNMGNRTIISRGIDPNDVYDMVGMGPAFMDPRGIAVEPDGSLVVVDRVLDAVVRVDLTTDNMGNRTIISKRIDTGDEIDMNMVGMGPAFMNPSGIAVEPDGSLVVVDSVLKAVVRVNKDGDRTIISDNEMGKGSGLDFMDPRGIAVVETW